MKDRTLLVIKTCEAPLFCDILRLCGTYCKERGYADPVIRNAEDGYEVYVPGDDEAPLVPPKPF